MTRRELAAVAAFQVKRPETRPNILFALSDDHSHPYLGCYGTPEIQTPNLDRFASEGMKFSRAFTVAPQCVPSRAGLMTGRSAVAARMTRFSSALPKDIVAIPDALRAQGYFTGICRRNFHLDGFGPPGGVSEAILKEHNMRTFADRVDYLDRGSPRAQTTTRLNEFFDKKPQDKPFFMWINFNDPHHAWGKNAIPKPHDPAKLKLPAHLPDLPGVRDDLGRYFDEIGRLDEEWQWVLDTLKQRGFADNTMVVFMGDNGMAFPHGKGSLYDPGLNVPLLARWPGKVKPGSATDQLVSGEDIMPTLLAAAGVAPPQGVTGRSFLPLLRGESFEGRTHVFAERGPHGNSAFTPQTKASTFDLSRCVRSRKFKLIYNCTPKMEYSPVDSASGPGWQQILAAHGAGTLRPEHERAYFTQPRPVIELFDLDSDPSELNNLVGKTEFAGVERELKIKLQEKMMVDFDYLPLPLSE